MNEKLLMPPMWYIDSRSSEAGDVGFSFRAVQWGSGSQSVILQTSGTIMMEHLVRNSLGPTPDLLNQISGAETLPPGS